MLHMCHMPKYLICINEKSTLICMPHMNSLALTKWPGALYTDDTRWCRTMMMTMMPQPNYIYWVDHWSNLSEIEFNFQDLLSFGLTISLFIWNPGSDLFTSSTFSFLMPNSASNSTKFLTEKNKSTLSCISQSIVQISNKWPWIFIIMGMVNKMLNVEVELNSIILVV